MLKINVLSESLFQGIRDWGTYRGLSSSSESLAGVDLSLSEIDVEVGIGRVKMMFSAEARFLPTIMMSQWPLVWSAKTRAIPIPDMPCRRSLQSELQTLVSQINRTLWLFSWEAILCYWLEVIKREANCSFNSCDSKFRHSPRTRYL